MANEDIKRAAKERGVKLYQLARELGMTDSQFSRKLRYDISDSERIEILKTLEKMSNAPMPTGQKYQQMIDLMDQHCKIGSGAFEHYDNINTLVKQVYGCSLGEVLTFYERYGRFD